MSGNAAPDRSVLPGRHCLDRRGKQPWTAPADGAVTAPSRIATPDLVTNSYFPALAAEELGLFREEGIAAHLEAMPSLAAVNALRDGAVDFVAGGAHTLLTAFPDWKGAKLVVTLSRGTPWLLVLRASLAARRGDVAAVRGLRIGAAHGPDRAFLHLLREAGLDAARDGIVIGPVPGADAPDASFGVLAADALERGLVDGFWANALGSETAVRRGVGRVVVDVRRGDGPPAAAGYTFAALGHRRADRPGARARGRRGAGRRQAQRALKADPAQAAEVGRRRSPPTRRPSSPRSWSVISPSTTLASRQRR